MGILERVQQLKQQGYSDGEIAKSLQESGLSPREINDALARSRIRSAIADVPITIPQEKNPFSPQEMQPSLITNELEAPFPTEQLPQGNFQENESNLYGLPSQKQIDNYSQYTPQPAAIPSQTFQENNYPEYNQNYAQQYPADPYAENYPSQGYGEGYGTNTETISEISSQIVEDKLRKINKEISELNELKVLLSSKVEKIDGRLEKIESIIDQLQISLLRKANEQEQNISDIKTEMEEMQEGFSKVLNPLINEARSPYTRKAHKPKSKRKSHKK